jgi:hypothetical protein
MTTFALRYAGSSRGPAVAGPLLRGPRLAWAALFCNVLTFLGPTPLVRIPTPVGQLIAQGMLPVALVLVLLANPGRVLRPDPFLALLTVMAVVALMVSIHNQFLVGSTYRAVRLAGFVTVLWLFTPWWGRPDLALFRAHLTFLRALVGSVVVGALLFPGAAFNPEGRLQGTLWPIPPPQVAHYAAVLLGCTVVLWFCGLTRGRTALITLGVTALALLESHTRTALAGLLIGLAVGGASLFLGTARVRRTSAVLTALAVFSGTFFGSAILAWISRGQSAQDASQLTGRTKVWSAVLAQQRPWLEQVFGAGLSNKSFQGLPIDSNWVATYVDLGWFGISIQITFLLVAVLIAVTRPRGPRRALALFLVAYCVSASFTETGLGDASPYLLDIAVAASLLASRPRT